MVKKLFSSTVYRILLSLLVGLVLLGTPSSATAQDIPFAPEHTVDAAFDGALDVYTADIDGDGDLDILGAAATADHITWWENTAGNGSSWTEHPVDTVFDGARSVYAADMDRDGDLDVLGAADTANTIAWWENANGIGTSWTEHAVDTAFDQAFDVYAADVDCDGDMDVLGAAYNGDDIVWWENTGTCTGSGGSCTNWTEHSVDLAFDGAHSVYAADVDRDGDMDILGAAYYADDITWWENTAGNGSAWYEHTVDGDFDGARSVYASDVDGDGDLDVLGAAWLADDITWYENTSGIGITWTPHIVDGSFDGAFDVHTADMDSDGDMDILGAANLDNDIAWWENTARDGSAWTPHIVDTAFQGADSVHAADVDGDGDLDVLGTAILDDDITWWENETLHRSASYPSQSKNTIDTEFDGAQSVYAADVDGDGDVDVLGAATHADDISWWENATDDGKSWTRHTVDSDFGDARSVYATDLDGDGDVDVLGTAYGTHEITWWENTGPCTGPGGLCSIWIEHTVNSSFNGARSIHAADVDGDGDLDVLGAAYFSNAISWWENTGPCSGPDATCSNWIRHNITFLFTGAYDVCAADVDNDGDVDILGAAYNYSEITWWENTAGNGTAWTEHTVDSSYSGARSVYAADMDRDGDLDVLGAAATADDITWWENTGPCSGPYGSCANWIEHSVNTEFDSASSVYAVDMDRDGDLDILGAGSIANTIAWWENTGPCTGPDASCSNWTEHIVDLAFDGTSSVHAADVDGDGDVDILGTAGLADDISWWENMGGQFTLSTTDTAPESIGPGSVDDILAIDVTHRGRENDGPLELVTLDLLFQGCYGLDCTPFNLTSYQASQLFDRMMVYWDDDGNGIFEMAEDTPVTSVTPLALTGGVQTVTFTDGDANVMVGPAKPRTYFVVVDRVDNPPLFKPGADRFTITHLTESTSTAEDRDHDIELDLEFTANITSSLVLDSDAKACQPISNVQIRREPAGDVFVPYGVTFFATYDGTTPAYFSWTLNQVSFGENNSIVGKIFTETGSYFVAVDVKNACGSDTAYISFGVMDHAWFEPDLHTSGKTVNLTTVESGDILTYTIRLLNSTSNPASATMIDPIPAYTTYVLNSAIASDGGAVTFSSGQLEWSGEVINGIPVLISYAVAVQVAPVGATITNTATVADGYGHTAVLHATSIYNSGYRLSINDGALYTNVPTVTLRHLWNAADDISHVKFSNDGGFGAASDTTAWLPVDPGDTLYEGWVLATYGETIMPRTVYALFRDETGIQYGPFLDDIIYDPEAPQVTGVDILGSTTFASLLAQNQTVTVRVTATDNNSGVDTVQLSNSPGFDPYSEFSATGGVTDILWDTQGSDTVYVQVMDRAGNSSDITPASTNYAVYVPVVMRNK